MEEYYPIFKGLSKSKDIEGHFEFPPDHVREDFRWASVTMADSCDYCGTSHQEKGRCISCGAPRKIKPQRPMTLGTISFDLPGVRGSFPECLHRPITIKP